MGDANNLIEFAAKCKDEEGMEDHLKNEFGDLAEIVQFLLKHIGDNVSITIVNQFCSLKIDVSGESLALLISAILKFI